jgi:protein SCO1/2
MESGPRFPLLAAAAGAAAVVVLLVVLAVVLSPRQGVQTGAVRSSGIAAIGGDFALTDQTGAPFTQDDLAGEPSLIYFGYTFCPDVCPLSLQVMKAAIDRLPESQRGAVRPVFVTVDPERDTVEQMRAYVATPGFPDGLIGLTGTPEQVERAKQAYRVYSAKGAQEGDFYLVDHTSLIYLMNDQGQFVAAFGSTESPETIAETLRGQIG